MSFQTFPPGFNPTELKSRDGLSERSVAHFCWLFQPEGRACICLFSPALFWSMLNPVLMPAPNKAGLSLMSDLLLGVAGGVRPLCLSCTGLCWFSGGVALYRL